ncbi:MAG TPA: two-component regulator propeller domain-containing protein [Puia sp.]
MIHNGFILAILLFLCSGAAGQSSGATGQSSIAAGQSAGAAGRSSGATDQSAGAAGRSFYFRHYQVEDGLSNNAVLTCVQDDKGFLWFGTKDGLNRFDGYTFKVFRHDPEDTTSIGNNFIHCLFIDNDHVLWAGTDKGLYRYDENKESFTLLPTPFLLQVNDIKMDTAGNLWFISNFNLFKYTVATQRLQRFDLDHYFEATSICTLADGSVWVSTSTGMLEKYEPAGNQSASGDRFTTVDLFTHSPKSVSNWIEHLYATRDGNILAGTSNQGVKVFYPASRQYADVLTYNPDHTEIFARNFLQTSDHECWIATESGIYIYNLNTRESTHLHKEYTDPYSISDNAVYAFCTDKEGGIWAGTYFGGVNYYPQQPVTFKKYFPENGRNSISGNVVREIIEDHYGQLWIGTEDAGLNKLDTGTGKFTNYLPTGTADGISYTNIHGLLAIGDELWIGTFEHGLDVMNIKTGKVIRKYAKGKENNMLRSNFIYCLYRSEDDDILIGTTIGAYRYSRKTDDFSLLEGMPLHNWYTSIVKDKQGVIWGATWGNGVNYYDTRTKKGGNFSYRQSDRTSLSHDRVNKIFQDSYHNLWFATEGGLCRFDPRTRSFRRLTTADGFPSNFILSIAEDDNRRLWISTTKGLVCFDIATQKLAAVLSKANGLLNDQFNFGSAFKDRNGNMYFGSVKGLISFKPGRQLKKDFSPPIYITGFQVNNKELAINKQGSPLHRSVTFTDNIVLTHSQSTFSIDFASLSYTAPEMSEYVYKMEGLDADWTYLKTNRKVYFTNLSPGEYTFTVKAAGSKETRLVIDILPPWWTSRWAYSCYTALILLLIWYITRAWRLRLKEKERRRIEQLEIAKEKELYEAKMQFFTNVAHEIKTPLTLIKGPLETVIRKAGDTPDIKDSLRIMERNTGRLVDLTNQLLDFRQTEINGFSLAFTEANISAIAEDIFTSFRPLAEQKGLSFNFFNGGKDSFTGAKDSYAGTKDGHAGAKDSSAGTKDIYAFVDTDAFNKILTNLLSNAVKYAKSKVELHIFPLRPGDPGFVIEVKNDGYLIPMEMKEKIFEPFFRLKETEKQKGTGIGLALSLSLTQLHKGSLFLKEPEENMNVFFVSIPINQVAL